MPRPLLSQPCTKTFRAANSFLTSSCKCIGKLHNLPVDSVVRMQLALHTSRAFHLRKLPIWEKGLSPCGMFPQALLSLGYVVFLGAQEAQQQCFKASFMLQSLFSTPAIICKFLRISTSQPPSISVGFSRGLRRRGLVHTFEASSLHLNHQDC